MCITKTGVLAGLTLSMLMSVSNFRDTWEQQPKHINLREGFMKTIAAV